MTVIQRCSLTLDDMDAYSEAVSGLDIRPRVVGSGPASVTQHHVDFGDVVIRYTRYSGNFMEEFLAASDSLVVGTAIEPILLSGRELNTSELAVVPPRYGGVTRVSRRASLVEYIFDKAAIDSAGLDMEDLARVSCPGQGQHYVPMHPHLCALAKQVLAGPEVDVEPDEVRQFSLDILYESLSPYMTKRIPDRGAHRLEVAREVARLVEQNTDRFLGINEIAAKLGLSERWIRQSFKSVYGMSIHQFMRESKLLRARSMLSQGAHNVTGVAMQLGFGHLSRFAQYYKQKFGELPVETLSKA